jgi:GAF domain-containing protein
MPEYRALLRTVMRTRQRLLVPDAVDDEEWRSNPDIELGMISYLGLPISWPNGDIFGTICVLDHKRNAYREVHHRLLLQLRDTVEADLLSVSSYETRLADEKRVNERLQALVTERTAELAKINDALLLEVAERTAALRESEHRFRDYAEPEREAGADGISPPTSRRSRRSGAVTSRPSRRRSHFTTSGTGPPARTARWSTLP